LESILRHSDNTAETSFLSYWIIPNFRFQIGVDSKFHISNSKLESDKNLESGIWNLK
jgi:hypothetical protein